MDHTVQVAIVTAAASIVVAVASFVLNKRAQRQDAIQDRKLAHYRKLLAAISDLAVDGLDKDKANQRFARSVNTIALVAPQHVILALMNFHDEVRFSNPNSTKEGHDHKLQILLLEMRKSMSLPFKDDPKTFNFHLVGGRPPSPAAPNTPA